MKTFKKLPKIVQIAIFCLSLIIISIATDPRSYTKASYQDEELTANSNHMLTNLMQYAEASYKEAQVKKSEKIVPKKNITSTKQINKTRDFSELVNKKNEVKKISNPVKVSQVEILKTEEVISLELPIPMVSVLYEDEEKEENFSEISNSINVQPENVELANEIAKLEEELQLNMELNEELQKISEFIQDSMNSLEENLKIIEESNNAYIELKLAEANREVDSLEKFAETEPKALSVISSISSQEKLITEKLDVKIESVEIVEIIEIAEVASAFVQLVPEIIEVSKISISEESQFKFIDPIMNLNDSLELIENPIYLKTDSDFQYGFQIASLLYKGDTLKYHIDKYGCRLYPDKFIKLSSFKYSNGTERWAFGIKKIKKGKKDEEQMYRIYDSGKIVLDQGNRAETGFQISKRE